MDPIDRVLEGTKECKRSLFESAFDNFTQPRERVDSMAEQNQNKPGQAPAPGGARPGAMTMAMRAVQITPNAGPKVLKIMIIRGGKIVEERTIEQRETVSVGTSEKNHFILKAEGLPARFDIFQLVGSDYILNFTEAMNGKVGLPGGVQQLDQLRRSGGARNAGSYWQVKLNDSSRGNIKIGDAKILFQFVTPRPPQPRPQLPAAARGGFVKGIDWVFTAIVVFLYILFFGLIVWLESADWPMTEGIAEVSADYAQYVVPAPEEPVVEETTDEGEEAVEEEAVAEAPKKSADSAESSGPSENDVASSAEARARIAEEAAQQVETALIGALGEGGALADVLAGGMDTSGAADVLATASGVGVATGKSGSLRTRTGGGGSGQGGGLGGLKAAGGSGATTARGTGDVKERVIRGNVSFSGGADVGGSGDFDQSQVTRKIKGAKSALKRCYENSLKSNPTLSGKVVVEFTIEPRGNVGKSRAVENSTGDSGFASCITSVVKRLRWSPGPDGGAVTYEYPFVFQPQN